MLEPFPWDGPLGQKGESLSLSQLCARSRTALEEFAWNAISEGTKKIYRLALPHFATFPNKPFWKIWHTLPEFLAYRPILIQG